MIPAIIKVGTIQHRVVVDADEWLRVEHAQQRKGTYGFTHYRSATIYLNPDMAEDVKRLTLWHEVMHALGEAVMGAPEWGSLGEEAEEIAVRRFEHPTLAVLRDNPELVNYLMEGVGSTA